LSIFGFLKAQGAPVAGPAAGNSAAAFLTHLAPKKASLSTSDASSLLADWGRVVKKQGLDEMQRILDLPDNKIDSVHDFTDELLRDPTKRSWKDGSDARLRPIQNRMLSAVKEANGGFFLVGTGAGKSFAALLAASVLPDCDRAIVFTPSSTVRNLEAEYYRLRTLFKVLPYPQLQIRSTDELSRPREEHEGDLLEELVLAKNGDPARTLLVFDEAHRLKNLESARGARVLRTILKYPSLRVVVMSGTMTTSSVKDCAHLAWYSLRAGSPFPQQWGGTEERHSQLLEALDQCIGQKGKPEREHWALLYRLWIKYHPQVTAMFEVPGPERVSMLRRAFQQRMAHTQGVVLTTTSALPDVRLHLEGATLHIPDEVQKAINDLMLGMDPNGMPIPDDVSMQRIVTQVAQGFYYVWDWPIGPDGKPKVDMDWKGAKSRWNKMVRTEIQEHRRVGYDSDFLVFNSCKRRILELCQTQEEKDWVQWVSRTQKDGLSHRSGESSTRFEAVWGNLQRRLGGDELLYSWLSWSAVQRHKPEPPVRGVWLSTYLLDHAIAWAKAQERPPILWYAHRAVGAKLTEMGVQAYGQGTEPPPTEQLCALSIKVHCEGKNLQRWSNQLVLCPPVNAAVWEQMLARTHRPGQAQSDVFCFVYQHVEAFVDAVNKARDGATYIEDTTDNPQKLLACLYKNLKLRKVTFGVDAGVDDEDEEE
jgi:hypothetical protein